MIHATLLVAVLAAAPATSSPVATSDPDVFFRQVGEIGYKIDGIVKKGAIVQGTLHLPDRTFGLALGGCKRAPAEWIAKQNANFDLIKLWIRDDGALAYSAGVVIDGLPRTSFKKWVDVFVLSANVMGSEAVKAGYANK